MPVMRDMQGVGGTGASTGSSGRRSSTGISGVSGTGGCCSVPCRAASHDSTRGAIAAVMPITAATKRTTTCQHGTQCAVPLTCMQCSRASSGIASMRPCMHIAANALAIAARHLLPQARHTHAICIHSSAFPHLAAPTHLLQRRSITARPTHLSRACHFLLLSHSVRSFLPPAAHIIPLSIYSFFLSQIPSPPCIFQFLSLPHLYSFLPHLFSSLPPLFPSLPPLFSSRPPHFSSLPHHFSSQPPLFPTLPPPFSSLLPLSCFLPHPFFFLPPLFSSLPPVFSSPPPLFSSLPPAFPSLPPLFSSRPPFFSSLPPLFPSLPCLVADLPPPLLARPASFPLQPRPLLAMPLPLPSLPPAVLTPCCFSPAPSHCTSPLPRPSRTATASSSSTSSFRLFAASLSSSATRHILSISSTPLSCSALSSPRVPLAPLTSLITCIISLHAIFCNASNLLSASSLALTMSSVDFTQQSLSVLASSLSSSALNLSLSTCSLPRSASIAPLPSLISISPPSCLRLAISSLTTTTSILLISSRILASSLHSSLSPSTDTLLVTLSSISAATKKLVLTFS
ncbi:unnamed protein product [Closterium sp. NIES-65]|nr:unnamed protein product [Closterium sp. NIES-65]